MSNNSKKKLAEWKKLSSKVVYETDYFQIVKDMVSIRDKKKSYTYMNLTDAALMIPVTKDKKIVMLRQFRYLVGDEVYEFPAGGLDLNESAEKCVRRECEEESGYKCGKIKKFGQYYESYGLFTRQIHIYFSNDTKKTIQRTDKDMLHYEEIAIELLDYKQVMKLADANKIVGVPSMIAALLLRTKVESGEIKL